MILSFSRTHIQLRESNRMNAFGHLAVHCCVPSIILGDSGAGWTLDLFKTFLKLIPFNQLPLLFPFQFNSVKQLLCFCWKKMQIF